MKKYIMFICFGIFAIFAAHGATICAKTNTYVGILKKNTNGTSSAYHNATKVWKVVFDYKTITGLAACNEISGTVNTAKTNLYTSYSDAGEYCWCKMEPVESTDLGTDFETGITSYWVLLTSYADSATCASSCTSACASAIQLNTNGFRSALFEAVW